ncbi:MAG TPA: sugar phosphate nucleotidyltransferase, partial [Elusimicrobiales bacterium]|nr:sugar phosphate nucleotidyltransferase [Elusimicrobiales bacterium]
MKNEKPHNFGVLILAAGLGVRMKSKLPKVLHCLYKKPLIGYVLSAVDGLKPNGIGIVVGHQSQKVKNAVSENLKNWGVKTPVRFIKQNQLTGSGRAIMSAKSFIAKYKNVVILCGDTPLTETKTLSNLLKKYVQSKAKGIIVTFEIDDPSGYGRIVTDDKGFLVKIVEQPHLEAETSKINEVNSGTYVFETKTLLSVLGKLKQKGRKKEFYLTDVIEFINEKHDKMLAYKIKDFVQGLGINSRNQLAKVQKILQKRTNDELMRNGVTLVNPDSTY